MFSLSLLSRPHTAAFLFSPKPYLHQYLLLSASAVELYWSRRATRVYLVDLAAQFWAFDDLVAVQFLKMTEANRAFEQESVNFQSEISQRLGWATRSTSPAHSPHSPRAYPWSRPGWNRRWSMKLSSILHSASDLGKKSVIRSNARSQKIILSIPSTILLRLKIPSLAESRVQAPNLTSNFLCLNGSNENFQFHLKIFGAIPFFIFDLASHFALQIPSLI